jgi:L-lysine 6-transaminase
MTTNAKEVKSVLSKHILADGFDIIFDYSKSHGSYLIDARDGTSYLDFFSMFGSMAVGYNHPYLLAHKEQFGEIAINKPSNSDVYTTIYADMVETFSRIGIPDYLPYAFFVDGGALAVENALKAAFDWKVRKNLQKGILNKGTKIIHFKQAFHGRSGYTMCMTNTADPRKYMYFPMFDWPRIHNPTIHFPLTDSKLEQLIESENLAIKEIYEALKSNPDDIAGLIIEPIQSEGGDNHFRAEFLQKLQQIAHEEEFLFICDEVQSGVCITGKFWAHQNYDIQPDIIAFGKKAQICGILAGPRLDEIPNHVFKEKSRINSTFGGNLVDMFRFKLILEIIENENLLLRAVSVGKYLLENLENLAQTHNSISNIRGIGLMCAFDLPNSAHRNLFMQQCQEAGLLLLACGDRSIRFRPHLVVCNEEIDKAIAIMDKRLFANDFK